MSQEKKESASASYSEAERLQVTDHIESSLGVCSHFYMMDTGSDNSLNLLVFAPAEGRPYYTMVTLGLGGYSMNVPELLRSEDGDGSHIELVGRLPASWKFDAGSLQEERWYWPIQLLEYMIHLGIDEEAFLDCGFKLRNLEIGDQSSGKAAFSGAVLIPPVCAGPGFSVLQLESGKEVRFCEIATLFPEESAFVDRYSYSDLQTLMEKCPDQGFPVFMDQERMNYGSEETLQLPWAQEIVEKLDKSRDAFADYMNEMMEKFGDPGHHHHHHHHHD